MANFTSNAIITFFSQLIVFFIALMSNVLIARILGPTNLGVYSLLMLILGFAVLSGAFGIEVANVYFTGTKKYDLQAIFSNSLVLAGGLGIVLVIIVWQLVRLNIIQKYLFSHHLDMVYVWSIVLLVPLSLLFSFLNSILLGEQDIVHYNKASILQTVLQLGGVVIFLVILQQGIGGTIVAYSMGAIGGVLYLLYILKFLKWKRSFILFNQALFRDSIKYGLKAYAGNLMQFFNYRLDVFLIVVFLNPAAVGFYGLAYGIAERLWMIPGTIATTLFPRVARLSKYDADQLTSRLVRHTVFIVTLVSIILGLLARWVIILFFGSVYLPSLTPLVLLLPGIVVLSITKMLAADLAGRGKPQFATMAAICSLMVNVGLNLFVIPRWGISGAAFSSTVSYTIATVVVMIGFTRITKIPWLEVLIIKKNDVQDYVQLFRKIRPFLLRHRIN